MMLVRTILAFDTLVALVIAYFFVIGLADGSVSSFNMGLWLGLLALTAAVLVGGWMLSARGKRAVAIVLLMVLFVPGFLYALFLLLVVITQPNWH
jgi:hypothetical protein